MKFVVSEERWYKCSRKKCRLEFTNPSNGMGGLSCPRCHSLSFEYIGNAPVILPYICKNRLCSVRRFSMPVNGGCPDCKSTEWIEDFSSDADAISPQHYQKHPSGVECITIAQGFNFNLGNVIKYVWRAGLKESSTDIEDLEKAKRYLEFEIARREGKK